MLKNLLTEKNKDILFIQKKGSILKMRNNGQKQNLDEDNFNNYNL